MSQQALGGTMIGAKTVTDTDRRALTILVTMNRLVRPQYFGELFWRRRYRGSNCSAPYARPAGRVLNRLRNQGFAEWVSLSKDDWGWRATSEGRREAAR
jgi:hypothetical protein